VKEELGRTFLRGAKRVPGSLQRSKWRGFPKPEDVLRVVERSRIVEVEVEVERVGSKSRGKEHQR
jgi:hypothetical protein